MKKQLLIGLTTGLFLYGMANSAMALNFDGSTTGTFENPTGAENMMVSGLTSQNPFEWGNGDTWNSPPSSLFFEGTDFYGVDDGSPFVLGTLNYFNGIIAQGTEAYTVDLNIELLFSSPSGLDKENFIFTLDLTNTLNVGTLYEQADSVYLPTAYSGTIFSQGGTNYNLSLSFGEVTEGGGVSLTNQFHVYEGDSSTAQLIGTITSDVAPVPEPATMLLFGTGMAGLAGYRRRQQAKKK